MSQWLLVIVLALGGAVFLMISLLRARSAESRNAAPATDVLRGEDAADLAEDLERHRITGKTSPRDVTGAPRAVASQKGTAEPGKPLRSHWPLAAGVAAVALAAAVGLYIATDETNPVDFSPPILASTNSADPAQPKLPDVDTMIARVAERLKKTPDNAEDWRMLGWSYFETQHYPEAVEAYGHAVSLQPNSAPFQSAYGEAQVLAAGGTVTADALKAFAIALKGSPDDERALHFVGLSKKTKGDAKGAIEDWTHALKRAKPDSLWAPRLRAEIEEAAKSSGINVAAQLPLPAPMTEDRFIAPPAAQQAQSMTPEEQQSMIRTMVAGLDERLTHNPRDRDGWMRLIRSRKVLGETDKARSALDRALNEFQDDPTTQAQLKTAAMQLGISPGG